MQAVSGPHEKRPEAQTRLSPSCLLPGKAVLRIHEIFVLIRMRIRILLFSSVTFKRQQIKKIIFFAYSCIYIIFSKIKIQKSQNSRNQCFFHYFCLMVEGPERPKNIPGSYGSGPATLGIRINEMDPHILPNSQ